MLNEILITIAFVALDLWTITTMLAVGMSLTIHQIIDPLRNVRFTVLMLLTSFFLVPLLAFSLTLVIPMGDEQQTAIILLGAVAGGPFVPQLVELAKGNLPQSVGIMTLFLIVSIFYAPLILPLMLYDVQVDVVAIAQDLILFLFIPLIIGLFIKWRYPDIAVKWQPHLAQTARFSLLLMIIVALVPALPKIASTVGTWLIPSTVLLAVGGTLIGYGLSVRSDPDERKVMTLSTGQRNLAAALLVAAASFSGDTFVMTVVAVVTLTIIMNIIAAEWGRRTKDDPGTTVDA